MSSLQVQNQTHRTKTLFVCQDDFEDTVWYEGIEFIEVKTPCGKIWCINFEVDSVQKKMSKKKNYKKNKTNGKTITVNDDSEGEDYLPIPSNKRGCPSDGSGASDNLINMND